MPLYQHYEKDSDGLCSKLRKAVLKQGGKEFNIDPNRFTKWEISPRDLIKSTLVLSSRPMLDTPSHPILDWQWSVW